MKKSVLIMFHLMFWIFTCLLIVLIFQALFLGAALLGRLDPGIRHQLLKGNLIGLLIILPVGACIFYASYFSLHFFAKRPRRFAWITAGYILFVIIVSIPGYWAGYRAQQASGNITDFIQGLFSMSTGLIVSPILYFNVFGFLFRTFIEWVKDRKTKAELEKDRLASQLELLRSKINPHFLFNTLNNIDVLMQEDTAKASDYLGKLSGILRFMLYESGAETIPLTEEIAYIQKYIDLQKIRTANTGFVKLEVNGNAAGKYISPMILIHFIENAFKYAGNKKIDAAVMIRFDISEKRLLFFCKNHIYETGGPGAEKSGLGIQLLKQKLDLLYKNNYILHAKEENNWYIVTLEIRLDEH